MSLFKQSKVTSRDGTTIGYQSIGEGPGVVLVHGALKDSNDYTRLAIALSESFTIHIMDRRGRGMSGPQGLNYAMNIECEDVKAIREATGANYLIGHSYGGLVSLESARRDSSIVKVALYEPGVLIDQPDDSWMQRYEKAMYNGDLVGAFTHFVRGMGNTPLTRLPYWYAKVILRIMVRGNHWNKTAQLLPQNLVEHREVHRLAASYRIYSSTEADMLLVQGSKSPNPTKDMMEELHRTLSHSTLHTLAGLDHFGLENDGRPEEVAQLLNHFFTR